MARTILIAGVALALAAARPQDLDAQLIAATGAGVNEIEQLLAAGADRAAHALAPLLDSSDAPELLDLARLIASDPGSIEKIHDLYLDDQPVVRSGVPVVVTTGGNA